MKVFWSDLAIDSLNKVYDFVELNWGAKVSGHLLELIDQSIDHILEYPKIGESVPDRPYRCLVVHRNVSLYYHPANDMIKVILIWDNRQNPDTLSSILAEFRIRE